MSNAYIEQWRKPDGSLASWEERKDAYDAADRRKAAAVESARQAAVKPMTHNQKVAAAYEARIAELRQQEQSISPGVATNARAMRKHYEGQLAKVLTDIREEDRQARYAADPAVKLVRENAESMRSWQALYPFLVADPEAADAVAYLQALASATEFDDPADMKAEYRRVEGELATRNAALARKAADEVNHQSLKVQAEAAAAELAAAEAAKQVRTDDGR